MTAELVFPKFAELPTLEAGTKIGKVYLQPFPQVWNMAWVHDVFYPAYRAVNWEFFKERSVVDSVKKAVDAHLERARKEWDEGKRISFLIVDERGEILGGIAATDIDLEAGTAILGWVVVRKDYTGNGIATAAGKVLVEWLRQYGFRAVGAHIATENEPSQAWARKVGLASVALASDIDSANGTNQQNLWWLELN